MEKYNYTVIEGWWRHNGIADRIQASGIFCYDDVQWFFQKTDDWWENLTDEEKLEVYNEFFDES